MPTTFHEDTGTLDVLVERVEPLTADGVLTVHIRGFTLDPDTGEAGLTTGGFPPHPEGLTVEPVPNFAGWLDVHFTGLAEPVLRYHYRYRYVGGASWTQVAGTRATRYRVQVQPGIPVDFQVAAENVSGTGVWSPSVRGAGGTRDGVLLTSWGTVPIETAPLTWYLPPEGAWGRIEIGATPLQWAQATAPVTGWGDLPVEAASLVWETGTETTKAWGTLFPGVDALQWEVRMEADKAWGTFPVEAGVLSWTRFTATRKAWGSIPVQAAPLAWNAAQTPVAAVWGRLPVEAGELLWAEGTAAVAAGWGRLPVSADPLVWRTGTETVKAWGTIPVDTSALSWEAR